MTEIADKLAARLKEFRPTATVAVSGRFATNPRDALDQLVASLGFQAIGIGWREVDKDEATALLKRVLEVNLAYDVPEMEPDQAAALAQEYLALAGDAMYFTNGTFSGTGWSGHNVGQEPLRQALPGSVPTTPEFSGSRMKTEVAAANNLLHPTAAASRFFDVQRLTSDRRG